MDRLLLVENSFIIVNGLSFLLKQNGINNIDVVSSFDNIEAKLTTYNYRLVVVSLSLKSSKNVEQLLSLLSNYATTNFLLFIEEANLVLERKIYKAGVRGIIDKTASVEEILQALQQVWVGEVYINKALFAKMLSIKDKHASNYHQLTTREKEIVNYMLQGKKNLEICTVLSLKPSNVSTFKTKIFSKLNIKSLLELEKIKSKMA